MARLQGPSGHYVLRSIGYLMVGSKPNTTCHIQVDDAAVPELVELGFTLIEGPSPAEVPPPPVPKSARKTRKSPMTTTDFNVVDREEIREETR